MEKYDFVTGDSIWVATDWNIERTGRVPAAQIEFVNGNLEIVERDGRKLLEAKTSSTFRIVLPDTLPDQFTVEFMLETGAGHLASSVFFSTSDRPFRSGANDSTDYVWIYSTAGVFRKSRPVSSAKNTATLGTLTPVRLQVDGNYAILYIGAERMAQVPAANFARTNVIEFRLGADANRRAYISDILVAVGLEPLYESLIRTGDVTTYGILFDVGSDRLRPESTPKLLELQKMLVDHQELRVAIEGHTDSTGDDESNRSLSERRAQSVVAYLKQNGIDAGRLSAVGKGEAVPVGDNATPAGRQQNRRVVIRKAGG